MAKTKITDTQEENVLSTEEMSDVIHLELPKLRLNDVSNEVISLKLLLVGFGYAISKLDTTFDSQTFASMQRFQKVNHIKQNDYCDEKTWKRLLSITT